MNSPGIREANRNVVDIRRYYKLLTQHRRIPPGREDCWLEVAEKLTECYDSRVCPELTLQRVRDQAARICTEA